MAELFPSIVNISTVDVSETEATDTNKRLKQISNSNLLQTYFDSVNRHSSTPRVTDYNLGITPPADEVIGKGRRPAYGLQYPRGYYNK